VQKHRNPRLKKFLPKVGQKKTKRTALSM
jgi:hypothetical protein